MGVANRGRRLRGGVVALAITLTGAACSASISDLSVDGPEVVDVDEAVGEPTPEAADQEPTPTPDAVEEPTPTPRLVGSGPPMPFTGLGSTESGRLTEPAVAVRVDNTRDALPQRGLGRADIVVENLVEANITRLLAVFHTVIPETVGPVRSARSSDIDIVSAFDRPAFAYWSSNDGVAAEIAEAAGAGAGAFIDAGIDRQDLPYYREEIPGRPLELTGFIRLGEVAAVLPDAEAPDGVFTYGDEPTRGEPTPGVGINWGGGQDVSFVWSETAGGWLRSEWGGPHLDADATVLVAANVVVLEIEYGVSAADQRSPQALTVGQGPAIVYVDGHAIVGTWQRADAAEPWELLDGAGNPVVLARGTTWLELVPAGAVSALDDATAAPLAEMAERFLG